MELFSGKYSKFEFFAKRSGEKEGRIAIKGEAGNTLEIIVPDEVHHFFSAELEKDTGYFLECDGVEIPYAYLCGNEDLFDKGIEFLEIDFAHSFIRRIDITAFHKSPIKEQYHFIPVKNWLNDPNGLCYYKGYYHMFYQANPVEQKSDFCYWGHAVSKDLVHWTYLPIAVFPQQELLENKENRGGAFSGSAIVKDGAMHIFFTRHLGRKENLQDFCEYQVKAVSNDGITFQNEKVIIASQPEVGMGCDFRDPKVTLIDGKHKLVLAGAKEGEAIMMAYCSSDLEQWEYEGILLEDEKTVCFECPDLYKLGGKIIATAALMDYVDENGRFRPTRYWIGHIAEGKFIQESQGTVDFGLNFYAAQSFQAQNRRIMIGWIADFNCEHIFVDNGCYGSMSIPREVFLQGGKLCMKPVGEIYSLKGKEARVVIEGSMSCAEIEGNSYYAVIELAEKTDLDILIARSEKDELWFRWNQKTAEICSSKDSGKPVRYAVDLECLRKVEIFFDRRVAEVFLNDGEAVGTRLFYTTLENGICSVHVRDTCCLKRLEVCQMESAWKRRKDL